MKNLKYLLVLSILCMLCISLGYGAVIPAPSISPRIAVGYSDANGSWYGSAATPNIAFKNDLDTGMYRVGANNIGFACGGSKILDISTTGITFVGTLNATTTTSSATITTGNINIPIVISGVTYYIKANSGL